MTRSRNTTITFQPKKRKPDHKGLASEKLFNTPIKITTQSKLNNVFNANIVTIYLQYF